MTPINQGGMFNMGNTSANSFTKSRNEFEDIYATAPMANAAMGGQPNGYARQGGPQQGRTVANTLTGETQFHPYTDGRMRDIEGSLRGSGQNMVTPSRPVPFTMPRGPMPIGSIGSAESSGQQPFNNGMMMDLNPESPTNGQMIPRGPMPSMAQPRQHVGNFPQFSIDPSEMRPVTPFTGMGGMFTGNTGGMSNSFAPQGYQGQQQQAFNNGPAPISGGVPSQDAGYNNGGLGQLNMGGTGESYTPQSQQGQQMALPTIDNTQNQGASIPTGLPQTSTFRPVTFRSGTGTSTSDAGGITTELNEPYSGLSGLVGSGSGLLGQAALQSQQAPNQFSYNFNPQQAGQELFNQRSALLEPAFAQQNTKAQEAMFGSGRLGLRLAGEGVGAGTGGMVSPDAFGVSQAQSQALAGLAQQSTEDAFAQEMQKSALDSNQFAMNQAQQQQRYANLMGSGQGMLSAGMQGTQLEQAMAQQQLQNQQLNQDYNLAQQNYNLAAQGQGFSQGLSNQQLALAAQGQAQDYGLNEAQFNLASQGQFQDYGLAQQQQLQDYGLAQQNYGLAQQQQMQDYGFGMQNYGLAQQQQLQDYGFGMQDYGLNQQKLALAQQQQLQDYETGMLRGDQAYGLQRDVAAQNYELDTERNRIQALTGLAQANRANYQPDPWLSTGVGLGGAFLGSEAGSGWLSDLFKGMDFF